MRFLNCPLFVISWMALPFAAAATEPATSAHDIVKDMGRAIYVQAERNGGSPAIWDGIENQTVAALSALAATDPGLLVIQDEDGNTPLLLAAKLGYSPILAELLRYPEVQQTIDTENSQGLSAYGFSILAQRETLFACHPEVSNPFALVPFLVTQPYYQHRDPYPQIRGMLSEAGADRTQARAKTFWLENCSTTVTEDRLAVRLSGDLLVTLQHIQNKVEKRRQQQEAAEQAATLLEIFWPQIQSGKMPKDELKLLADQLYYSKGLEPPQDLLRMLEGE